MIYVYFYNELNNSVNKCKITFFNPLKLMFDIQHSNNLICETYLWRLKSSNYFFTKNGVEKYKHSKRHRKIQTALHSNGD